MSAVVAKPFDGLRPSVRALLRWGVSLVFVVVVHSAALMVLRRSIPATGPTTPEAIMMDLAPEPAAPPESAAPPAVQPPPDPAPIQPTPEPETAPEPLPVPDVAPLVPLPVAPPVPQPEVSLPPPRPRQQRPPPSLRLSPAPQPTSRPMPETPQAAAPPAPAASAPPGQIEATWEGQLLAHIASFKRFPPAAERRGEQGVVLIHLRIGRGGSVLAMSVARGSGYADLDDEAQAWLTRAQPLPPFPPEITAQQMEIIVPLRFMLR